MFVPCHIRPGVKNRALKHNGEVNKTKQKQELGELMQGNNAERKDESEPQSGPRHYADGHTTRPSPCTFARAV
jgi:hypothetical protein